MDYDIRDRRPFWSNYQASEQCYGILSFDPGNRKSVCYVDDSIAEWSPVKPLARMNGMSLSALSDEKFVYLLIRDEGQDPEKNKYAVAVSGLPSQGNYFYYKEGLIFKNPTSQCIIINGKDDSAVYVDAYSDIFYRLYSLHLYLGIVKKNDAFEVKNSGIFNPINLVLRRSLYMPLTDETIPPSIYETGRLLHGNANPKSKDYNSLADFFINSEKSSIEIRIPWQILNVADPSTRKVVGDLYVHDFYDINPVVINGFTFELYRIDGGTVTEGGAGFYTWKPWETVHYHERLKKSYDVIKQKFSQYKQAGR